MPHPGLRIRPQIHRIRIWTLQKKNPTHRKQSSDQTLLEKPAPDRDKYLDPDPALQKNWIRIRTSEEEKHIRPFKGPDLVHPKEKKKIGSNRIPRPD